MMRLANATWTEVRGLDRTRSVAILPVGAVEAHGPHLPLDTDVIIAEAMAEAGAGALRSRGYEPVILPPIHYTPAGFAASFPGTISLSPETLAATVVDIANSLHRGGISALAVANAHLDPDNLSALHAAAEALNERGLVRVVLPDVTRRPWGNRLTEEFRSGACHAGRYEGSIVLAAAPERVRQDRMAGLPANPVSLSSAIEAGHRSFGEAGGPDAYFGAPAEATAEEGRETIRVLGEILADAVTEMVGEPGG